MSCESRIQITVKLPAELHGSLSQAIKEGKYQNMTAAIITALEKELQEPIGMSEDLPNNDNEVQRLTIELQKNVTELEVSRATFEGIQRLTEEKDKRIVDLTREVEGLKKEVERLDMFAHYFKSVDVKQIEAPVAERVRPWWKFW
jgi:Arc/MetJ-type ribon-helix-helix transcriptional regulator